MRTQDAEAVGGLTKGMLYIELIYKKKITHEVKLDRKTNPTQKL